MNKSYISVWNDVSGTWVAAPETAKARGRATASSSTISSDAGAQSRPATSLKAAFMPIAMAIGAMGMSMTPGMAAAQAVTGNGGLELCPGQLGSDAMGSSWGPVSSAVQSMRCNNNSGMSFSLNNGATDNGANGYTDGAITARVAGYADGHLELAALSGIYMLNTVNMRGNKITQLGAGDVSLGSSDAVNGGQLYQYTRYFQANSPSTETASSARATGSSSVASGPYSLAAGANSSAYGANAVALASNSVALGAGSVASRSDAVSVGYLSSDGKSQYTRQITNVTAGAAGTDAVNVNQLNAAIASVNGGGGGGTTQNAVTYDSSLSNLITLKGTSGTKITNLIAGDATSKWSTDAVNGGQLFQTNQDVANVANNVANVAGNLANVTNVVNNFVNNGIAGNPLIVTYDSSARDIVTLGGTAHTAAVKLTNVAAGDISSANSTDAVNGGQLFQTNQTINSLGNNLSGAIINIYNHGVKYFHTNSTLGDGSADGTDSVAVGALAIASANNSVALGSNSVADRVNAVSVGSTTAQRQIINVAAGTQSNDAVNLGQMNAAIAAVAGGGSPDAVIYDSSAHNKLTLGGAQATSTVGLTNVAAGQVTSASKDAVNGAQLYGTASTVANALGGGSSVTATGAVTNPTYTVQGSTYNDVGSALSQVDTAISGLNNEVANSSKYIKVVSAASSAIATGSEAVSIGGAAYASGTSAVAIGSGARSQFANSVALGANSRVTVANTVSVGDVGAERRIMNVANGVSGTDAVTYSQLSAVQTALSQQISQSTGLKSMLLGGTTLGATPVTSYIAVSSNVTAGTTTSTDNSLDAMAIGPTATALGQGSLAVGAGAGTALAGSTAVGSGAAALALDTTVIGAGATTSNAATNAVAIGYNAAAQGANALSLGSTSMANASNALAMGGNAVVTTTGLNAMAFGANATANQANAVALGYSATAGASNAVALGSGSLADRANTVSVGSASAQRQVVNVAAGTLGNDAVNINQLTGVTGMIGGGAGVNADGTVKKPSFIIGGQTYSDVGSAITAATASGSANAVQYDSSARNKVTLGGLVGTPAPVTLTNVANGVAASDAVNVAQLQAMGGTFNSSGVATNAFVAYDDTTKSKVTLGGAGTTKAVTLTNVANGISTNDAVNVAQLQAMGGTFNSSGVVTNAFVAYDDTTKSKVTLGGAGTTKAVTLTNVANGISTNDAVNVAQLQAMGGTFNSSGVVTNAFVAYDDTTKSKITLGGAGATRAVTLGNVANGISTNDAVNVAQLQAMGGTFNSSGVVTNAFVAYDDTTKSKITLGGAGTTKAVTLTNVANGISTNDAVNVAQLQAMGGTFNSSGVVTNAFVAYDDTTKSKITLGGAGATRAVTLGNVANGIATNDAVNVAQLQAMGGTFNSSGVVTNAFVAYDDTTKNTVTLKGASGSTKITGLKAGTLSGTSLDAVNGSQLYSTASSVANALGGGSTVSSTGALSAPSYQLSGATYSDVGSALSGLDSQVGAINNNIADTTKYIKVVSASSAALATGGEAVAIGGGAYSSGTNAVAIGSGARSQFADSVALGSNSRVSTANSISVGDIGSERRIMNVANGVANTDAVTLAQLNALKASLTPVQSTGLKSMLLGAAVPVTNYIAVSTTVTPGLPATSTDNTENAMAIGPGAMAQGAGSVIVGAGSGSFRSGSTVVGSYASAAALNATVIGDGATTDNKSDNSVAIGYMAAAQGVNSLALGSNSVTNATNSVTLGNTATVATGATNSMALGAGSTATATNAVAIGYNSVADRANAVSVGSSSQRSQIINVAAGTQNTDAVNLGQMNAAIAAVAGGGAPNAVVYDTSAHTSVTLGAAGTPVKVANVADGVANNDAVNVAQLKAMGATIGSSGNVTNAFVAYDDTSKSKVTFGGAGATAPVILTNVGAGQVTSSSTQAINGSQLYGAMASTAAALGGGASVNSDGTISKPTYKLNGGTYSDVGAALVAAASSGGGGSTNAVLYDTSAHTSVTLNSAGAPVKLSNVADGVANNDAVNVEQLKAMGASIGSSGNVTNAFVAYDDTTKTKVTFGGLGSTTPVILSNVGSGQVASSSTQAINGSQLYGAMSSTAAALGGSSSVTANGTVSKPAYVINGSTYSGVGAAISALDAQSRGGSPDAVIYDTSAHDKLTLGGAGSTTPVTIANVADATSDNEAVNLKQLKAAGLNVDPSGNVTNAFVAYDNLSKGTVTFNSGGTPTQLKNVAAGTDATDAVNVDQMKTYVAQHGGDGTANGVAYDDSSKTQVTLGGAGSTTPVTLTNVADGKNATDAVNYGQFSALENTVKNFADGGGSTYITVNNPGTGGTAAVASGTDAIAIGNGAVASGSESIAIGKDTKTTGDKSVAMGSGASAPNANSVALGANSTTDRDNTVSVGSAGAERQITNVAAGTQATDAVNLGQLNNAMGSMSNSINNVDRNAAKGIAAASALNIVTPYLPGRTTINAGVANYRGYQAVGLGVSRWNEKGTINYNLGVSSSGGNSTIVRAGIGIVLGN